MVNESIVLSEVLRYRNSLNERTFKLFGVDLFSISKQKLLNDIGHKKEKLHQQLKRLLKDETLSLPEGLSVLINYDGIIKPICKGCKRKLRFIELTDEFIKKCDYCNTYNDLNQEFEKIKEKLSPTVTVTSNKIDDVFATLTDKSAYENMNLGEFKPRPATSGNASETVIQELCIEKFKNNKKIVIITNKNRQHETENYEREFDLIIEELNFYVESNGSHYHGIMSETVKGRVDYHISKRKLAESKGYVCIQYSTSFGSRRSTSICIRRNIERSILSNNNLSIETRLDPDNNLRMELKHLYDVNPIIVDDINYDDIVFGSPMCVQFRMNCPEGFINKSEYRIATLLFESKYSNKQCYPFKENKWASMIQYRIIDGVVCIYKHYDYNNHIVNPEYNSLTTFANHFRKNLGDTTEVKYFGNRDTEQLHNLKFYGMPFKSHTTREEYLKNYLQYPIFKKVTEAQPIWIVKSIVDIKKRHVNDCDYISKYSFESDPFLSIPVTKETIDIIPGHNTIINSGCFILDL